MNNEISDEDFQFVSEFACRNSAIVLGTEKRYLVEARLIPVAKKHGHAHLGELVTALRGQPQFGPIHSAVIDALTTNETYFFRDFHPFEALRQTILPSIIKKNRSTRSLSIWSAACSTGQEAYSIAMLLKERFPELSDWNISIQGTDLSSKVLEQAEAGRYNQIEVNRGLPAPLLLKYFTQERSDWIIDESIRKMVTFQPFNLIKPWPVFKPFDLILIRNVLIYFDLEIKKSILKRIGSYIRPNGYLMLGTAESVLNVDPRWKMETVGKTTAYRQIAEQVQSTA